MLIKTLFFKFFVILLTIRCLGVELPVYSPLWGYVFSCIPYCFPIVWAETAAAAKISFSGTVFFTNHVSSDGDS